MRTSPGFGLGVPVSISSSRLPELRFVYMAAFNFSPHGTLAFRALFAQTKIRPRIFREPEGAILSDDKTTRGAKTSCALGALHARLEPNRGPTGNRITWSRDRSALTAMSRVINPRRLYTDTRTCLLGFRVADNLRQCLDL